MPTDSKPKPVKAVYDLTEDTRGLRTEGASMQSSYDLESLPKRAKRKKERSLFPPESWEQLAGC